MLKIDEPKSEWSSIKEIFEDALKHEKFITENINKLMDLTMSKKDYQL